MLYNIFTIFLIFLNFSSIYFNNYYYLIISFSLAGVFSFIIHYNKKQFNLSINLFFLLYKISLISIFAIMSGQIKVILIIPGIVFIFYLIKYFITKTIINFLPYIFSLFTIILLNIFYYSNFYLTYDYFAILMFYLAPLKLLDFFNILFFPFVLFYYFIIYLLINLLKIIYNIYKIKI